MKTIPFTYLIGWNAHNKFYYGVRYAKGTGPDSLWKTYFTSSKSVKTFREHYGEPDVIQVRKQFTDKEDAKNWELRVLTRLGVPKNKKYLNLTRSLKPDSTPKDGVRNGFFGKKHTEETRAKMRASNLHLQNFLGKKHTEETKAKISAAQVDRPPASAETRAKIGAASVGRKPMLGKKHSEAAKQKMRDAPVTDETREKMSMAWETRPPVTEETRTKLSAARIGRKHSDETRAKMRETQTRKRRLKLMDALSKIVSGWIQPNQSPNP